MKKFSVILLSILLAVSAACAGLSSGKARTAKAEGTPAPTEIGCESLELLLPGSYEQYLPLSSAVSSIAVAGKYIAVADNDAIHVYDGESYRTYYHEKGEVSQLELFETAGGYTLYFQDKFTDLYRYDCNALAETETAPHTAFQQGSAFTLSASGDLYFSRISESYGAIYVNNASDENIFDTFSGKTTMYYDDGFLYYTTNGNKLVKRSERGSETAVVEEYTGLHSDVTDIVIYNGALFYTAEGNLYTFDLNSRIHGKTFSDYTYSALCTDGNYLYALAVPASDSQESTKILRMDMRSEEFTDYQIGTSSAAENRLIGARKSILNGDNLIVADYGRIVVYNRKTDSFTAIETEFSPDFIASNGKNILVAKQSVTASEILIYDFNGNRIAGTDGFIGGIVGAACVREADYYLTTSSNVCYKIDGETFQKTQASARQLLVTATDLASDVYGNLYVEYSDKNVYKYTEEEFLNGDIGEIVYKFPTVVSNLAVDFDGNVYGSAKDTLYCSDGASYQINADDMLYGAGTEITSFAFGYESRLIYLVYPDYILSTESIDLPNINNLATGNSYYNIFTLSKELSVVSVKKGALLIDFSLSDFNEDSAVFPSCSYSRSSEEIQTIVMDESLTIGKKEYYVIGVFDAASRSYSAKLVLKEFCTPLSPEDYLFSPTGFDNGQGYVTNDVYLYKYPYLNELVSIQRLSKNTKLTVIGELSLNDKADFSYYYVRTDGDQTVYGYVPKNFVRNVDTVAQEPEIVRYTPEEITGLEALRYLLVALLALLDIGIVINYIYIRTRNKV